MKTRALLGLIFASIVASSTVTSAGSGPTPGEMAAGRRWIAANRRFGA